MIRILLVDDHDLIRVGIRRALEDRGRRYELVGEARTGEDAIRIAKATKPDTVLMDLNMPGMGGLEATRKLLRFDPDLQIIIISIHEVGPMPMRMLQVGARGYLSKNSVFDQVIEAIEKVHSGHRYVSDAVAKHNMLMSVEASPGPIESVSPKELEVLMLVAQGMRQQQIAERLCLSVATVSTMRLRLRRKLGAANDVQLTHIALRYNLISLDELAHSVACDAKSRGKRPQPSKELSACARREGSKKRTGALPSSV